mmetsp:Transcript_12487/g.20532  ORF Transcript_12487/g.20532 Transcript_12487/m.20532 type:complete len:506 (-) Transcript_12487:11-1528(-)
MLSFWNTSNKDEKKPLLLSSGIGRLGSSAVLAIVWFNVSGGPIGSEQVISYGGPIIGLASLVLITMIYSVPQALMTAELSTALPHNGGYSIWVLEAFGDFWGFQETYYSIVSGVVDNALYPLLLYSSAKALLGGSGLSSAELNSCQYATYLNNMNGGNPSDLWSCMFASQGNCAWEYLVKLLIVTMFVLPILSNNRNVGMSMLTFMGFVLLPFAVMCAIGVFEMHPYDWLPLPKPTEVDWAGLFNVAFWSVTGFDCCSTFAHEIDSPRHRILPNALFWSVAIMLLGYLLPLGVGAAVDKDWHCWADGSLTHVAQLIGGNWLGFWVLLSTLIGTWGQFGAELFEDSYQLLGMAEVGLIPRFLSKRWSLTGAPIGAMMLQIIVICVMIGLNFNAIIVIDNFFATAATILEFAALIKLRISNPEMARPFAIPVGTCILSLLLVPAFVMSFALLWINASASLTSAFVCIGGLILGIVLYIPLAFDAEAGTIGDRLRQIETEEEAYKLNF